MFLHKKKRCIIYLDAFYEYHYFKKKTYPFRIGLKDDSIIALAGIYDEWVDKSNGQIVKSCSIVTQPGKGIMNEIHNNPEAEGACMPAFLTPELQDFWLNTKQEFDADLLLNEVFSQFDYSQLTSYSVRRLKGKESVGNTPLAEKKFIYPELDIKELPKSEDALDFPTTLF